MISTNDRFEYEQAEARQQAREERDAAYERVVSNDPQGDRIRALEFVNGELVKACEQFTAAMRKHERPELLDLINALHVVDAAVEKARAAA